MLGKLKAPPADAVLVEEVADNTLEHGSTPGESLSRNDLGASVKPW